MLAQPPILGTSAELKLPGTSADSVFSGALIQISYLSIFIPFLSN